MDQNWSNQHNSFYTIFYPANVVRLLAKCPDRPEIGTRWVNEHLRSTSTWTTTTTTVAFSSESHFTKLNSDNAKCCDIIIVWVFWVVCCFFLLCVVYSETRFLTRESCVQDVLWQTWDKGAVNPRCPIIRWLILDEQIRRSSQSSCVLF